MRQSPPHSGPITSRRGWVVKAILHEIFTGRYKGGDRLVESELGLTAGVSRTPVREALGELASIGVIDLKPNHGAVVKPFGPTQIHEMYHIRQIFEVEATRLAASRIDESVLRVFRERNDAFLLDQPRSKAWSASNMTLDQEFHEFVSVSSGNMRLAEEIGRYRTLVEAVREAVGNTGHAQDVALVEHNEIIDSLLERNSAKAAEAMARHNVNGTERAINALFSKSGKPLARTHPNDSVHGKGHNGAGQFPDR